MLNKHWIQIFINKAHDLDLRKKKGTIFWTINFRNKMEMVVKNLKLIKSNIILFEIFMLNYTFKKFNTKILWLKIIIWYISLNYHLFCITTNLSPDKSRIFFLVFHILICRFLYSLLFSGRTYIWPIVTIWCKRN